MELSGKIRNSSTRRLDFVFGALSDSTRRKILARLAKGELPAGAIAAPFSMSQPAVSKHLKVLERAGLIERRVEKQKRMARIKTDALADAVEWFGNFRNAWSARLDAFEDMLSELQNVKTKDRRK